MMGVDEGELMDSTHRSQVFALADHHVDRIAALDPEAATEWGIPGSEHLLTNRGLDAERARADVARETLAALAAMAISTPLDEVDRIAMEVMRERLLSVLEITDSGESQRFMSVIWSPASGIRQIFELMPTESADERHMIGRRLEQVGPALESWRESLADAARRGEVTARRQVLGVADQVATYADGALERMVQRMCAEQGAEVPEQMRAAAVAAQSSFADFGAWLRDDLAPKAPDVDGVGRERYALWARSFNGADMDLDETYAWGWAELERITARMESCAERILSERPAGSSFSPVVGALDADPRYQQKGTDALLEFLRGIVADATDAMSDTHFDIDPSIRTCEVRLAPEGSAAAPYYIGPSEDLSRPGITWFPVVGDSDIFPTWSHVSTWYHEAVPGHHLQIGVSTIQRERQSRFQRLLGNTSGYAEGWALYAERFMDELGYFQDPGTEMGYLSAQAMRAARVVVDIGLHLGLSIPAGIRLEGEDIGGQRWDADLARRFMVGRALLDEAFAASEIDRYLGIPGQAISYKVGERAFLECREDARMRLGAGFDLKAWHMHALLIGGMGLDTLRREMATWAG
jgi:uncharacterized protein (DUF885 family)